MWPILNLMSEEILNRESELFREAMACDIFDAYDKEFAADCLEQYLAIKLVFPGNRGAVKAKNQLIIDLTHSGLLVRLLSGKSPFPTPPPRSFSYPWYQLLETKQQPCDVYVGGDEFNEVFIDQCRWDIKERVSSTELLVSFNDDYLGRLVLERPAAAHAAWTLYLLPPNLLNGVS